jgi:hypothetical protein
MIEVSVMGTRSMFLVGVMIVLIPVIIGCENEKPGVESSKTVVQFSSALPSNLSNIPISAGGAGNAEMINSVMITDKIEIKVSKKNTLSIVGWAANIKADTIPTIVIIQLTSISGNNSFYASATRIASKRPDLADYFKNPKLENSSYQLDADISSIPQGKYLISILQSDGKYVYKADTIRRLEIE